MMNKRERQSYNDMRHFINDFLFCANDVGLTGMALYQKKWVKLGQRITTKAEKVPGVLSCEK